MAYLGSFLHFCSCERDQGCENAGDRLSDAHVPPAWEFEHDGPQGNTCQDLVHNGQARVAFRDLAFGDVKGNRTRLFGLVAVGTGEQEFLASLTSIARGRFLFQRLCDLDDPTCNGSQWCHSSTEHRYCWDSFQ